MARHRERASQAERTANAKTVEGRSLWPSAGGVLWALSRFSRGGGAQIRTGILWRYPVSGVEGGLGGNLCEEENYIPVEESMKSLILK